MTGIVTEIDFGVKEYVITVTKVGTPGSSEIGDECFISFEGAVGLTKLEKALK